MTKEEAYELMQKQNWYKLFIKDVQANYRNVDFNECFRNRLCAADWIDRVMWWDSTSQGHQYWRLINTMWGVKQDSYGKYYPF